MLESIKRATTTRIAEIINIKNVYKTIKVSKRRKIIELKETLSMDFSAAVIVIITEELFWKKIQVSFHHREHYVRIHRKQLTWDSYGYVLDQSGFFCCLLKSRHGHNTISSIFFIFYALNPGQNNIANKEIILWKTHTAIILSIVLCTNWTIDASFSLSLAEVHHRKLIHESIFSFLYILCCCTSLRQILLSYFKIKWNRYNQRNRTQSPTSYCSVEVNPELIFPNFKLKLYHEERS